MPEFKVIERTGIDTIPQGTEWAVTASLDDTTDIPRPKTSTFKYCSYLKTTNSSLPTEHY